MYRFILLVTKKLPANSLLKMRLHPMYLAIYSSRFLIYYKKLIIPQSTA